MKKLIIIFTLLLATNLFATEWWESETSTTEISSTETNSIESILTEVNSKKYYIVKFEIKQVHYSLNLKDHAKDAMNKFTLEIPVDKEYYDNVRVGQEVSNGFRMGSLMFYGSAGKWKVVVKNKYER